MAAGAACKLRMFDKSNLNVLLNRETLQIQESKNPKLFVLTYTGTGSATKTEISAPNAVFNGTGYQEWSIVSAHADDTNNAAKDCREVSVIKLMLNGTYEIEKLKTAGQTAVPTTSTSAAYALNLMHMYCSDWGTGGKDAHGNITLNSKGYQEGGLTGKTGSSLTGLAASTAYQYQVDDDGGGNHNYTFTTGTVLTWTAVLALMNAQSGATCLFALVNGDVRCSSLTYGAASSIEMSAGAGGNNLFASLTGWAEETAVAGAVLLTIAAGYNESDGSAIFIPLGLPAVLKSILLTQNSADAVAPGSTLIYADVINCNGDSSEPDFDTFQLGANWSDSKVYSDLNVWVSDGGGKITFSESKITTGETFFVEIHVLIYGA